MADVNTQSCDECGKLRVSDANHWYKAVQFDSSALPLRAFYIMPWNLAIDPPRGVFACIGETKTLHLCGMECAVKAMTKALTQ